MTNLMKNYKMRNPNYRKSSQEKNTIKINGRTYNRVYSYPVKSVAEKRVDTIKREEPGELVQIITKKNKHNHAEYQVFTTANKSFVTKLLALIHI